MTFKKHLHLLLIALNFVLFLSSCEKDSNNTSGLYSNGVFIACEGTFNLSNASVSFYSYETDSVYNNIFKNENKISLGDVAQSITIHDNRAFIIVNNSNKVEVVDANNFKGIATLTDLSMPRYLLVNNNKAYISCWGDQTVCIFDLINLKIIKKIPAGIGPEKMVIANNKLFVTNTNAFDYTIDDSTVTVINLQTDELITNLNVGAYNPVDIEIDKYGKLWVLCRGKMNWDNSEQTSSYLIKINPDDLEIEGSYELFADAHPANLCINSSGDKLYYGIFFMTGGVYAVAIDNPGKGEKLIDIFPYGLEINPENDEFFVTNAAADYVSNGTLQRYSAAGELLGTYTTGVNGSNIGFKNAD
jgi:hypothetical protein